MYASKTMCDMTSPYRHSNKVGQILALCWRCVCKNYFPLTAADFFVGCLCT